MFKRLIAAGAGVVALGATALVLAPSAGATANAGTCSLAGTAAFGTPLTLNTQPFTYTFSGTLSNCQSGNASTGPGGPTGGSISTIQSASGSGSCASSTTSGYALATWNDGDTTVYQYSTTGYAAAVALSGTVIPSYTITNPDGTTTTYTTNEPATPAGDSANGVLTFNPNGGPTACQTGVQSAGINGQIGQGSTS